ncbi:MAG: triose-phosphate isomerase [Crocinitomicaceae bacterium]
MAQKVIAGNWKMNLNLEQSLELIEHLNTKEFDEDVRIIVFPPALFVQPISSLIEGDFEIGVQNFSQNNNGAYTGEISITQSESVGVTVGLIGHSERRAYNSESNELLKAKVNHAVVNNFDFIFCCGEPLSIREAGKELTFVKKQLQESLFHLTANQINGGIIAYEPVWAIGTGVTASSVQAEDMHKNIREWLTEVYSTDVANSISILYGGSCDVSNAKELLGCPNVDGGLIGGASLKAEGFSTIIQSY